MNCKERFLQLKSLRWKYLLCQSCLSQTSRPDCLNRTACTGKMAHKEQNISEDLNLMEHHHPRSTMKPKPTDQNKINRIIGIGNASHPRMTVDFSRPVIEMQATTKRNDGAISKDCKCLCHTIYKSIIQISSHTLPLNKMFIQLG